MKKILTIIFLSFAVLSASSPVGTATGQFLDINMQTRNMAMGNAATSLVGGAGAVLINPAGLVDFKDNSRFDTYVSYLKWPADISLGSLGAAYKLNAASAVSISAVYVNYGDELRTTPDLPFGDDYFSMSSYSIGLSYSRYLTNKFSIGATIKNVSESFDGSGYSQIAYDMGTMYRTGYKNIRIAMSILHFSKEATFSGKFLNYSDAVKYATNDSSAFESWPLPMTFRTGISMDVYDTKDMTVTAALDMIHSNNANELYGAGVELNYMKNFFLRSGFQFGTDIYGLTFGGGVSLSKFSIDYAFNTMDYFGGRHRFSLCFNF